MYVPTYARFRRRFSSTDDTTAFLCVNYKKQKKQTYMDRDRLLYGACD